MSQPKDEGLLDGLQRLLHLKSSSAQPSSSSLARAQDLPSSSSSSSAIWSFFKSPFQRSPSLSSAPASTITSSSSLKGPGTAHASASALPLPKYDWEENFSERQDDGMSVDLTQRFVGSREARISKIRAERQRLMTRLDKLKALYESTPKAKLLFSRKSLEQEIVPWAPSSMLGKNKCYRCGTETSHTSHCRLCGQIMCQECTCDVPMFLLGVPEAEIDRTVKQPHHGSESTVPICNGACIDVVHPSKETLRGEPSPFFKRLVTLQQPLARHMAEIAYAMPGLNHLLAAADGEELPPDHFSALVGFRTKMVTTMDELKDLMAQIAALKPTSEGEEKLKSKVLYAASSFLDVSEHSLTPIPTMKKQGQAAGAAQRPKRNGDDWEML